MSTRICKGCETTPLRSDNVTGLCQKCVRAKAKKNQPHERPPDEAFEASGNSAVVTRPSVERIKTLADLIRVCEIDTSEWVVERWVCNKWEMGAKDAAGELNTQSLFQIKAWLKRNAPIQAVKAEIASLLEDAKRDVSVLRETSSSHGRSGLGTVSGSAKVPRSAGRLLELAIPDLHLGKLAWAPETGYTDYDVKIAERLFDDAVDALIERTKTFTFERILFPVGNDLLHSDNKQGMTTRGTQMDTDTRYYKAFGIARRLISRAIDRLRTIAPVTVICVPGNHDQLSTYHLSDSLSCLYHDSEDVEILGDPTLRKYYQYGKVALMFTHGDKGKATDWPLVFATEQPAMFGSSVYREVHTGHLHQTKLQEFHGVRVRISPALCAPDSWHSDNQFVGNLRGAEGFVWDREEGLITVAHFTPKEGQ